MLLQSSEFRLTIACEADRWTLYVSGDLDLARSADLADVAEVLAERRVSHVAIDLGHVTFVDSAGYRSVERATAILRAGGSRVRVLNPSPAVTMLGASPLRLTPECRGRTAPTLGPGHPAQAGPRLPGPWHVGTGPAAPVPCGRAP